MKRVSPYLKMRVLGAIEFAPGNSIVERIRHTQAGSHFREQEKRLTFAKAHTGELWQADTMVGPYVKHGDGHIQVKLIAFIDDASRVCCHGEFFLAENTDTLIKALRSALYKRGVPDAMYVDHGSIYTSKEITQICERLRSRCDDEIFALMTTLTFALHHVAGFRHEDAVDQLAPPRK
jgi:transposase InsO family protein